MYYNSTGGNKQELYAEDNLKKNKENTYSK